ncbi:hypothetical protein DL505_21515, partial [Providencia stuartii]
RAERATVDELTAAQNRLNYASRALRGTMALLGGPVGAAMMLGGALFYVSEKAGEAKQKALELNSVIKITIAELANLSRAQLGAKLIEYKKEIMEMEKVANGIQGQIHGIKNDHTNSFGRIFGKKGPDNDRLTEEQAKLDTVNQNLNTLKANAATVKELIDKIDSGSKVEVSGNGELPTPKLTESDKDKGKNKALNDYRQLRKSIE